MPGSVGWAVAGVWYLLLGLCAPLVAARRSARGEPVDLRLAWRSFTMAAAMLLVLFGTVLALNAAGPGVAGGAGLWPAVLRGGLGLLGLLATILLAVQAYVALRRRGAAAPVGHC